MHQRRVAFLDSPQQIEHILASGLLLMGGAIEFAMASTKQEALEIVQTRPTDLIVTGLTYLDGTADQFLAEINSHPEIVTPTMLLASHDNAELSKKAMSCGVFDVLWHPLNVEMLFKRISFSVQLFSRPKSRIENFETKPAADLKQWVKESKETGLSVAELMIKKQKAGLPKT